MMNMMFGNGYGYGGYGTGMMGGWGATRGVVAVITLVLFWALMVATIAALWAWYKKNK